MADNSPQNGNSFNAKNQENNNEKAGIQSNLQAISKHTSSLLFLFFVIILIFSLCKYIKNHYNNLSEIIENIHYEKKNRNKSNYTNMIYPRYYHSATKLDDGNIIFIGGGSKFSEIYDIKTKKFIKGPECKYDRYMHNIVKLSDGNLLVIGGTDETNSNTEIRDIELYDWKKQKFFVLTQLNHQLFCPQSVVIDKNKILVISPAISGSNKFSELPVIINLDLKKTQVINDFPEKFYSYFQESIVPIKVDNDIIFYKSKMGSKALPNLLWNGKTFKEINGFNMFDDAYVKILPIGKNKIFYTRTVYSENNNSFFTRGSNFQMGIFDLKTNTNENIFENKRDGKYLGFIPMAITEISNSNIVIAGGRTYKLLSKTVFSKDIYMYKKNQNKIEKIGLLYKKTLRDFSVSEIDSDQLLICGGRIRNNQHKSGYEETSKCQIIKYNKECNYE